MGGGLDVLRAAWRARLMKGHPGSTAQELGIGIAQLDDFANGRGTLPREILSRLANDIYPGATYDAQADLLDRPRQEVTPLCTAMPEPYKRREPVLANYRGCSLAPQPVNPPKRQKAAARPGWKA